MLELSEGAEWIGREIAYTAPQSLLFRSPVAEARWYILPRKCYK
jgi:hypothetical protein